MPIVNPSPGYEGTASAAIRVTDSRRRGECGGGGSAKPLNFLQSNWTNFLSPIPLGIIGRGAEVIGRGCLSIAARRKVTLSKPYRRNGRPIADGRTLDTQDRRQRQ